MNTIAKALIRNYWGVQPPETRSAPLGSCYQVTGGTMALAFQDPMFACAAYCAHLCERYNDMGKTTISSLFGDKGDDYARRVARAIGHNPDMDLHLFRADGTVDNGAMLEMILHTIPKLELFLTFEVNETDVHNGMEIYELGVINGKQN